MVRKRASTVDIENGIRFWDFVDMLVCFVNGIFNGRQEMRCVATVSANTDRPNDDNDNK